MAAENPQATMQGPPTATRTRVTVVRGQPVYRDRRGVLAGLALLMAIVGGINLGLGLSLTCYNSYYYNYNCDYRRTTFIISGSCFLVSAVCCLVRALVLHNRSTTTIRMNQLSPAQQPVTVSPGYPGQPVIAVPTVPTQYPPPYYPPTEPAPYPLSPADNQYPPPAGFTVSPQPTESYLHEATKPPPYSP